MMSPEAAPRKRPLSGYAVVTGEPVIPLVIPPGYLGTTGRD
jgi:hypothetical protein